MSKHPKEQLQITVMEVQTPPANGQSTSKKKNITYYQDLTQNPNPVQPVSKS